MTRRPTILCVALAASAFLALTGCRGSEPSATDQAEATAPAIGQGEGLSVRDAMLSLPSPSMGAAYFAVDNPGATADRLVGISSSQVAQADLHETVDDGGVMRMLPRPEGFEIPAGSSLELTPGGAHVMLVGPAPEDGAIELTLTFETHEPIVLRLAAPAASGDDGATGHTDHSGHMNHQSAGGQGS